jgi:hypothetical protein
VRIELVDVDVGVVATDALDPDVLGAGRDQILVLGGHKELRRGGRAPSDPRKKRAYRTTVSSSVVAVFACSSPSDGGPSPSRLAGSPPSVDWIRYEL